MFAFGLAISVYANVLLSAQTPIISFARISPNLRNRKIWGGGGDRNCKITTARRRLKLNMTFLTGWVTISFSRWTLFHGVNCHRNIDVFW